MVNFSMKMPLYIQTLEDLSDKKYTKKKRKQYGLKLLGAIYTQTTQKLQEHDVKFRSTKTSKRIEGIKNSNNQLQYVTIRREQRELGYKGPQNLGYMVSWGTGSCHPPQGFKKKRENKKEMTKAKQAKKQAFLSSKDRAWL